MFYKVTLGFTTGATYNMTNVHVFKAAQARRAYFFKNKIMNTLIEVLSGICLTQEKPSWTLRFRQGNTYLIL